ncbi:unknown protein [Desulfotalea psychrophila LSv54]|uniref:Uncharacterized protein n=1 Tax=Desulfotalea psychrophila (strain LSv54 / DSM 12343) TaxID=177439 RepID=Q6AKF9_DESPS|nr:unknown protein [Desulfotalea psychrophila LSv54]
MVSRASIEFPGFDGSHRIVACQPPWPKGEAFPPLNPMPPRPSCQSSLSFQLPLRLRTDSWAPLAVPPDLPTRQLHSVRATERGEGPPLFSIANGYFRASCPDRLLVAIPIGIAAPWHPCHRSLPPLSYFRLMACKTMA